ncbi:MAG: DUF6485 family protein [Thermoplasmatota archaeon]
MECNIEENLKVCNCTYPFEKRGHCCACVAYHRRRRELPGCYFSKQAEATYDRSVENYIQTSR